MTNPTKSRLAFIDLLRGWALLVMIEVHVFNAFILPELKLTTWYNTLNYINGLVAPSFIFISGFVFLVASQKKLESFRKFGSAFWKQLSRIGMVWAVGYILHLPYFSYHRTAAETDTRGWMIFFQSDVLHCIAFGLFILFLLRLSIKNDRVYRSILLLSGITIAIITKFIWDIDFTNWLPIPIAAYMNSQHFSLFPIFPWLAFMLFGGYFAAIYITAREMNREKEFIKQFIIIGALLFVICALCRELTPTILIGSVDVRANPFFFFERIGIVIMLLALCWLYVERRKTDNAFVLDISRESLLVYSAHLLLIYGKFFNGHSLSFYYGKTLGVFESIIGALVLMLLMISAAISWGWLKKNHQPLARLAFWMFAGTTTIWFFMN